MTRESLLGVRDIFGRRRVSVVAGATVLCTTALGGYFASPAFAYQGTLEGTPCSVTARVCLDLDDQKMWIAQAGKITYGPIRISSGGEGKETPKGAFKVLWKNKNHVSKESRLPNGQGAPMPNSVFFAPGGIALHGGDPKIASAGCIHVPDPDDAYVFDTLKVGEEVQVVESLDRPKGGFYGVNNLERPSEQRKRELEEARNDSDVQPAADEPAESEDLPEPDRHS